MRKQRVFISHISEEAELAVLLKNHIEQDFLGLVELFVSSEASSIPIGDQWLTKIDGALKNAKVEIILCSKQSIQRPWINFEAGAGWIRGIPIVPICHSGLRIEDLPAPLNRLQAVQADTKVGLSGLYKTLANTLKCDIPHKNFDEMIELISNYQVKHEAIAGLKEIERQKETDILGLVGTFIRMIDQQRVDKKLTRLIQQISLEDGFDNSLQERMAAWKIGRARDQIENIRSRKWEIAALSPTGYVAFIFESLMNMLAKDDEYLTITNINFWSHNTLGRSAFLDANISASSRDVIIRRVFIVDRDDWAQRSNNKLLQDVLGEHLAACARVNTSGHKRMHVRILVSETANRDMSIFGHFGIARHLIGPDRDDGSVIVVPRYETHLPGATISHLRLLFSRGASPDVGALEYFNKFRRAYENSFDLESADLNPSRPEDA
jgi:hypothetical protein